LDTYVSQAIFSELRNDQPNEEGEKPEDANIILGTYINKDSSNKPAGVKKMLKRSKPRLAQQYIGNCDLIVYDLHSGNPMDVKMAIDALSAPRKEDDGGNDGEKVLILISSLLSWDATPRKLVEVRDPREVQAEEDAVKKAYEGAIQEQMARIRAEREKKKELAAAEAQVNSEEEAENQEEENFDEADMKEAMRIVTEANAGKNDDSDKKRVKKRMLHQAFTEADYQMREASEEYACIREAEEAVLNFKKENVKVYVIAAGLLYGNGEAILNSHFKKAWLQDPARLPVVGQGNNLVPTVHVTDLARMVKKVFESKPERSYIFGIDTTKKPTQKRLITAISKGIGTGLTENIDIPHNFAKVHPNKTPLQLDLDWRKFLLMNIKAQPSSLFVGGGAAEGEEEAAEDADFQWHSKAGLAGNIPLVKKEFCQRRDLKPFKIAVSGKPCTGKSHFSHKLADHYNVPHIHTLKVLEEIEHWQDEMEAN
jgi:adenylate kinase